MPRTFRTLSFPTARSPQPAPPGRGVPNLATVATFGRNPGDLTMKLFVPAGLAANAPLVVVLHGCTQSAEGYAVGAGWLTLAEQFGFALLCPEQKRANNPNLCFNWFQPGDIRRGGGEAASIHAMVRWALATHALDPSRVFVTGLSAGGAMTAVMLAAYPDVFAGGAVIAGLAYGSAGSMQEAFSAMTQAPQRSDRAWGDTVRSAAPDTRSWPAISIWHGAADATVRPAAGEALVRQWVDVHDVRTGPVRRETPNGRPYEVWANPEGRTVVEMHRIEGLGHGTPLHTGGPDGHGAAGPFLIEAGVSSSLEIAQGWGVAPQGPYRQNRKETPGAPGRQANPGRTNRLPASSASPRDVGSVIDAALRSAGLIR